jgi:hypothetical protein
VSSAANQALRAVVALIAGALLAGLAGNAIACQDGCCD